MTNKFHHFLTKGRPLGTWLMSGAPSTAEALGHAGFDFLVLDMEHVPVGVPQAIGLLRAIGNTMAVPVVRLAMAELGLTAYPYSVWGGQAVLNPTKKTYVSISLSEVNPDSLAHPRQAYQTRTRRFSASSFR